MKVPVFLLQTHETLCYALIHCLFWPLGINQPRQGLYLFHSIAEAETMKGSFLLLARWLRAYLRPGFSTGWKSQRPTTSTRFCPQITKRVVKPHHLSYLAGWSKEIMSSRSPWATGMSSRSPWKLNETLFQNRKLKKVGDLIQWQSTWWQLVVWVP